MPSHSFIKFPPNLQDISSRIWLLLGEVQSKCEYSKVTPIPPEARDRLQRVYLTKGVHGTTSIEGNTFSEEEVGKIIKNEMDVPLSREYQKQQILNMVKAFNKISQDEILGPNAPFTLDVFNTYHHLVLSDLESILDKDVEVGAIRTHRVEVGGYLGAPPEDCERLLQDLCNWLNSDVNAPQGYELAWQILKALVAHVYFAWIHPYGDGNGRTARLLEFAILLRAGVPDIAAHLLSNFYNKTRDMYYKQLQDSHGDFRDGSYPPNGKLTGFIEYALQGFKDELDNQTDIINIVQLQVIWHDFIHSSFPKNLRQVEQRRKRLILDMSDHVLEKPVKIGELRELTPAIALAYQGKTDRTIQRDIDTLIDKGLLSRNENGYMPNFSLLGEFFSNSRIDFDFKS